jgi:hypothetical protein
VGLFGQHGSGRYFRSRRQPRHQHVVFVGPLEVLVAEHRPGDAALVRFAEIVRDADGPAGQERFPEAAGLRAMTVAFPDICDDDQQIVVRSAFLYDALYAALTKLVAAEASAAARASS